MRKLALLFLLALVLVVSCAKLPEKPAAVRGDIAYVRMIAKDAIPAAWGRLVAVSNSADFGHIFQLWFEDEGGAVRVAFYDMRTNSFQSEGRLIPRSQEGVR
ncbi:hypothetical protein FJ251_03115 [bacterium]|nr:hypothetical protein [bacterium]